MTDLCARSLEAALGLLPLDQMIETLPELLDRAEKTVSRFAPQRNMNSGPDFQQLRVNILQSLEQRLQATRTDQKAARVACLAFLPYLTSIIEHNADYSLKRTAVICIDFIAEKFGKKGVDVITETASIITGQNCLAILDTKVRLAALLCLATITETLREAFIPLMPQSFPLAMDHLVSSSQGDFDDAMLHDACYAFTTALLLYIPWMMTGIYLDRFFKASHESANADMGMDCDNVRIECLRLAAKSVDAKECFLALDRTWTNALAEGPKVSTSYSGRTM